MKKEKIYTLTQRFDDIGSFMVQCETIVTGDDGEVFKSQPFAMQLSLGAVLKLPKEGKTTIKEITHPNGKKTETKEFTPSRKDGYKALLAHVEGKLADEDMGIRETIKDCWDRLIEATPYPADDDETIETGAENG